MLSKKLETTKQTVKFPLGLCCPHCYKGFQNQFKVTCFKIYKTDTQKMFFEAPSSECSVLIPYPPRPLISTLDTLRARQIGGWNLILIKRLNTQSEFHCDCGCVQWLKGIIGHTIFLPIVQKLLNMEMILVLCDLIVGTKIFSPIHYSIVSSAGSLILMTRHQRSGMLHH